MLSDILEKYQETEDSKDKQEILDEFLQRLWGSKYKFKRRTKTQSFNVSEKMLYRRTDLIDLFKQHNTIEYMYCQSFYTGDLSSIDYIRIHINNMYGYLIDRHVYLPKEYYSLLWIPKQEYLKSIEALKKGAEVDANTIRKRIENSQIESAKLKNETIKKKINLKFSEYKELINTYIERLFNNYTPIHEYEEEYGWEMRVSVDGWSEDNYVISYFCKSLSGYMRNYARSLKPKKVKKRYCLLCNIEINSFPNNKKYCSSCAKSNWKKYNSRKQKEYRRGKRV